MICYGSATNTVSSSSANGTYYSSNTFDFPITFIEPPIAVPSVSQTGGIYFAGLGNGYPWKGKVQVRVLSLAAFTDVSITFSYIAIGKWK